MDRTFPFNDYISEYEDWFKKYPYVFKSEVAAIKQLLLKGENVEGIEIGVGTGRFAKALGIKEGIEPAEKMRAVAGKKGITVLNSLAEKLPYKSLYFDFVLINFCVSYFDSIRRAFTEAYRVLKHHGVLIVGFIDKNSSIGRLYQRRRVKSIFYKKAKFYTVSQIMRALKSVGFKTMEVSQTLFHNLDEIKSIELPEEGYGKGSYIFIKAAK